MRNTLFRLPRLVRWHFCCCCLCSGGVRRLRLERNFVQASRVAHHGQDNGRRSWPTTCRHRLPTSMYMCVLTGGSTAERAQSGHRTQDGMPKRSLTQTLDYARLSHASPGGAERTSKSLSARNPCTNITVSVKQVHHFIAPCIWSHALPRPALDERTPNVGMFLQVMLAFLQVQLKILAHLTQSACF